MLRPDRVRLFSEYEAESPLWSTDDMLLPEELGLSDSLVTAINEWQGHFHAHYRHETAWDSAANRAWYGVRASEIVAALDEELPAGTEIDVSLWPLESED